MTERRLRREIAEVCHWMHERGYIAATDGSVSARVGSGRILVTPSGMSKREVTPGSLILCDLKAHKIRGDGKITSEVLLHLTVYKARPDLSAVVHAHPVYATALTVAGVRLDACVLPEVCVSLGRIPTTEYATPSSNEGPRAIAKLIRRHDAMLLDRHGSLTAGRTPAAAYYKLEKVEHAAKVLFLARQLGKVRTLNASQTQRLVDALKLHGVIAKVAELDTEVGPEE